MSKIFPISLIVFIGASVSIGCKGKPAADKPKSAPPTIVDVIIAKSQPVGNSVEANGTVIANEYVELRPEVSGRLTYLNVPEGQYVKQGTVLARINSADLAAQLQKSRVQLQLATLTDERLKKLLDVQGINQADYDANLNTLNSLKADIAYTQTLIDKTVIRAPFSGTIGLRKISPGAYVSSATVIATIQQLGKAKVDFTIPEEYSNLINVGSQVSVDIESAEGQKEQATVVAVEPQANTQTRNILVRALLSKATPNTGAFVKVFVGGTGKEKNSIMVPTNIIIPDDRSSQLIVVKNGKASFVNVQTGIRQADNVEITSGVSDGDTIVVTGVLFARPNAALNIRSVKTLEQLASTSQPDNTTAADSTNAADTNRTSVSK
jgi:membrane fusion protein (multidrug efflux system)